MIVRLLADILRESQRVPAVVLAGLLIALTLTVLATCLPGMEPHILTALQRVLQAADQLPAVRLEPYFTLGADGSAVLNREGDGRGDIVTDALLPLFAWITGLLVAVRWVMRVKPREIDFLGRMAPMLWLCGLCSAGFLAGAYLRSDIAALWSVFLTLIVAGLVLAGWAALFAGLLDQAGRRFEALFARREG